MKATQIVATLGFSLTLSTVCLTDAKASNLAYMPQNPAIFAGVNPGNESALMSSVVQPKNPNLAKSTSQLTASAILEQSVLSQVSQNIITTIFSSHDTDHGSFDIGNGSTISYLNTLGVITLTINDAQGTTVLTF